MKRVWNAGTQLYPLPAVIVSCGDQATGATNLITVAWTGTVCTDPAMLYISVRPERYSHSIIEQQGEFTVNLTTREMARATDLCGVKSGRDTDKWKLTGLTPGKGVGVKCPPIEQSPLSIECKVVDVVRLGSHDMFIARVVDVLADEAYFDAATDRFCLEKAGLISYTHGHYYEQGAPIGHFGFSVRKK